MQGYLFSKPRSAEDLAEVIEGPTLGFAAIRDARR
jgi:EAL domain-containing protein (putative c-di-GMP-specific phosphodiesterase class I)